MVIGESISGLPVIRTKLTLLVHRPLQMLRLHSRCANMSLEPSYARVVLGTIDSAILRGTFFVPGQLNDQWIRLGNLGFTDVTKSGDVYVNFVHAL